MPSPSQKDTTAPPAATRRQLLLTLPALCLAPAALANKPKGQAPPNRVKLPTDTALAVSVRVKGRFTSLYNQQTRQLDLPTTVCNFAVDETPTESSLDDHEIAFMPDIAEAGWGAFEPADETLVYHFDIADERGRLDKLVVSELDTGRVVGTLAADPSGATILGDLTLKSGPLNYLLRGTDRNRQPVFQMVSNNGKADSFVFFPLTGSFQPFRTMYNGCGGFADNGSGPAGDSYSLTGAKSSTGVGPSEGYTNRSVMEVFKTETNDRAGSTPMNPPQDVNLPKRHVLTNGIIKNLGDFKPTNKDDLVKLLDLLATLTKEDATTVLSDITMPPYSENCGRWSVSLTGTAVTILAFPFNRAKNHKDLVSVVLSFFNKTVQQVGQLLSEIVSNGVKGDLNADPNATGRLVAGEIKSLGNLYVLEAQAAGTAIDSKPILDVVSLKVTPEPADPDHLLSYEGTIELVGPNTMSSPPPVTTPTQFQVTLNENGEAKINLPKGWKWKFTGNAKTYGSGTSQFPTPTNVVISVTSKKP